MLITRVGQCIDGEDETRIRVVGDLLSSRQKEKDTIYIKVDKPVPLHDVEVSSQCNLELKKNFWIVKDCHYGVSIIMSLEF